jgi:hypothetical protein
MKSNVSMYKDMLDEIRRIVAKTDNEVSLPNPQEPEFVFIKRHNGVTKMIGAYAPDLLFTAFMESCRVSRINPLQIMETALAELVITKTMGATIVGEA